MTSVLRPRMLGVLGGMGPMATAYFYQQLVTSTPAVDDQTHIPVIIWGDGRIPDRTDALFGPGASPIPAMTDAVRGLIRAGADLIAVPCNTAHAFLPELSAATGARFIDMIGATVEHVLRAFPHASRIGVLSTRGTRMTRLYDLAAAQRGLITVHIDAERQSTLVDEAIRVVKRGGDLALAERLVYRAAAALKEMRADIVIAACTELPMVVSLASEVLPVIDSVQSLAESCVRVFFHPSSFDDDGWDTAPLLQETRQDR